jgi:hypothetical protein
MYSGELESQIKRKIIAVLHDETSKLLNAGRELSLAYNLINANNSDKLSQILQECSNEIDLLNKKVMIEISQMGGMLINREDILRTIHLISEISGTLDGIAFRVAILKLNNDGINGKFYELIDMVVDTLFKLNEITRAMSINPQSITEIIADIQKVEKDIDLKYRTLLIELINNENDLKRLILLKDMVDMIEKVADKCLEIANSFGIITLNL